MTWISTTMSIKFSPCCYIDETLVLLQNPGYLHVFNCVYKYIHLQMHIYITCACIEITMHYTYIQYASI